MEDTAKSIRPPKREVIELDDDDSTNSQPAMKSVKREEPDASSEVVKLRQEIVKLQQEVIKKEDMFQHACRATRAAELRAEAAESQLDSKHGIKDDFNAEKKRADELEMRLAEVLSQMEEDARRGAECGEGPELARENEALRNELAEMRKGNLARVNNLTVQRNQERQKARENEARDRVRIEELTQKLTFGGKGLPREPREHEEQRVIPNLKLQRIGHPTNILQLSHPDSNESTPFAIARREILSSVEKHEGEDIIQKVKQCWPKFSLNYMKFNCDACSKTLLNFDIIVHFLRPKHQNKVSSLGAAVSTAAFEFWMDQLKSESAAQPMQQQPPAAAAASSKMDGESKTVENEKEVIEVDS